MEKATQSAANIMDVAKAAGVSHMTVSRVLNHTGNVKPATVKKVEAAMTKLGYRRNPMVQALMSQVRRQRVSLSSNLAWLEEKADGKKRDRIALLRDAASQRAAEIGYGFETIFHEPMELSAARIDSILKARGVRGVIIAPIQNSGAKFNFPWSQYSVATIGRSLLTPAISHVMMHFQHAMDRTLQELKVRGYKRIAFMTWREADLRSEHLQLMAFLRHNYLIEAQDRIEPIWMDDWSLRDLQRWYDTKRPEVIISSWPSGWPRVQQLGLRTPEELGFVALSRTESSPEVSGIRVPIEAMASGVVDAVVAQIHRNEQGLPKVPKCMLVEASWENGTTLRQLKE